jgi:cytochrome c-type biogenesis protein CcmH
MAEADPRLLFALAAACMVGVAMLFVWPLLRRQGDASQAAPAAAAVAARPARRLVLPALVLGFPAAALALYVWLGDPGALNADRSALSEQLRLTDAPAAVASTADAYAELEGHLQRQPGDARALVVKARLDMSVQRYEQAAAGYQRALEGPSKVSRDATVWVEYAEARGMLQGGTLVGQPQQLVEKALSIDPDHPQALDLAGSAAWETGDFASAARYWKRLLAQIPAGSVRHVELSAAIARADQRARLQLPSSR